MTLYPLIPGAKLVRFVFEESSRPLSRVVTFGIISGIAGGGILAAINQGAQMAAGSLDIQPLLLFSGLLALFLYSKRYSLINAVMAVEEMLQAVRNRVAGKIADSELEAMERIGPSYVFNRLSQDTILISDSAHVIFASFGALIMLVFSTIYIAIISFEGFIMTLSAISLGVITFLSQRRAIIEAVRSATSSEVEFLASVEQSLNGFKEIKLNRGKANDLLRSQAAIGGTLERAKKRAGRSQTFVMMFSQAFFYALLGIVVFVWPVVMDESTETVIKVAATILFIIGPIDLVVGSMPLFMEADVAVENLKELERRLEAGVTKTSAKPLDPAAPFVGLQIKDVKYRYPGDHDETAFTLGPINLEVTPGEILFIVGGNGSGKSTLLKILTGLYYPTTGEVLVDGSRLERSDYPQYRQSFSAIFTDFFLFDKLYGVSPAVYDRANELLKWLDISKKTTFDNGGFTNRNLSTGQRKRLALVAALLEERAVYVFDEIAADQDPEFRRRFYEEILPTVRDQGATVIAVTHDDRYFKCADRVVVMEEGQLRPFNS
jgi:putative ATP-binding cassette transporter